VDGQITIGNITLAEPHELTLHAAFLAGDGIGRVHLEVHFVVGGFAAQHLVLRQVQDVVGHFGHAACSLRLASVTLVSFTYLSSLANKHTTP